ncbi:unnamed protein product, partial [Darwinula stevensoni]
VSHIFLHEDFDRQNFDSDIALLQLEEDAMLTERVQLVAGWGSDGTGVLPNVLMEVELPILSNRECRKDTILFTGDPHVTRTLTTNLYCAGMTPIQHGALASPHPPSRPAFLHSFARGTREKSDGKRERGKMHADATWSVSEFLQRFLLCQPQVSQVAFSKTKFAC